MERTIKRIIQAMRHHFRTARQQGRHMLGAGNYSHPASTRAQRRLRSQHDGATHTSVAAQQQQMTKHTFMGAFWARWQQSLTRFQLQPLRLLLHGVYPLGDKLNRPFSPLGHVKLIDVWQNYTLTHAGTLPHVHHQP